MSTVETAGTCTAILDELERMVVGRRRALELVLIGILAGGHVLLEDLPGLGKTLTAEVYAEVVGKPLYRVHSGQLGVTATSVEATLTRILQRAAQEKLDLGVQAAQVVVRPALHALEHVLVDAQKKRLTHQA